MLQPGCELVLMWIQTSCLRSWCWSSLILWTPSDQSLSCVWLCDPMNCSMPGFPVLHYLLEFAQTHVHWIDDAIQPSHPLFLPSPSSFNLSHNQDVFQWVSPLHQVAKVLELQFQPSLSNEYSGLISFTINWINLLAVLGTLKSLLQHHTLKASILQHSAFLMVQLSHPYMATGKTKALTIPTFVRKVMSLLFNTLSRFVITFIPRSKLLFISWLQ